MKWLVKKKEYHPLQKQEFWLTDFILSKNSISFLETEEFVSFGAKHPTKTVAYHIYFTNIFLFFLQFINKETKNPVGEVFLSDMIFLPAFKLLDYLGNRSH